MKMMLFGCNFCLVYNNLVGLALCSYFPLSRYPWFKSSNLINGNSHLTFQSNSFLNHWGEMLAPQKSKLKKKQNPEKQDKKIQRAFTKLGLHSNSTLPTTLNVQFIINAKILSADYVSVNWALIEVFCCCYPYSNICTRKEFLNLGSGFIFLQEKQ